MMSGTSSFRIPTALLPVLATTSLFAQSPRFVEPNDKTGSSSAVVVDDVPLVHTTQILPPDLADDSAVIPALIQIRTLLDRIDRSLGDVDSDLRSVVKLNVSVSNRDVIGVVQEELAKRFPDDAKPAVSYVVSRLPRADAVVTADAVATTSRDPGRTVMITASQNDPSGFSSANAIVPRGTRIYVSGQAERNESLAEATRGTLQSLKKTLNVFGRRDSDIVQIKAFLQPMSDVAVVQQEIAKFFGDRPVPPTVFVEWQSGAKTPIEIELIAWGGMNRTGDVVEYLAPPDMKVSPVFSRVARVNHSQSIYVSGLYADDGTDNGDDEVRDVFAALDRILKQSGSDLKHLVKATYYVSNDDSSRSLNALRPEFYDPQRPPAASKAMVADVGLTGRGLTLDMIAVPAIDDAVAEYGPPRFGRGLNADEAAAGWLVLFDGKTTFGWKEARVANKRLSGGATTTAFGACEIWADVDAAGTLVAAGHEFPVSPGRFAKTIVDDVSITPIELRDGATIRSLGIRPLNLKPLFSGRDLTNWKRIDRQSLPENRRPQWSTANGALHAIGGPGCMEYVGGRFDDFILQLDVRTNVRHANGGVFFRAIPGDFMNGYEAQVFNRSEHRDPTRPARWCTGGIDDRQNARRMVSRDGHFFRMTIIAQGPHIATWVNGFQQVDWTDTRSPDKNPRKGLRVEPGTIQLQAHDPDTDVEFRSISAATW